VCPSQRTSKLAMSIMIKKKLHYNQIKQYVAHVVNVGAHMDLSMLINKLTRLKLVIKYDTHDHGATF
jgi:hypothetical protein